MDTPVPHAPHGTGSRLFLRTGPFPSALRVSLPLCASKSWEKARPLFALRVRALRQTRKILLASPYPLERGLEVLPT